MSTHRVFLVVGPDGRTTARTDGVGSKAARQPIAAKGLDGRLLRLFDGWMARRDRKWTRDEIRPFGQLLHRTLFRDQELWTFVQERLKAAEQAGEIFRLLLSFPADGAASSLASLPWEYLHSPDDDPGFFLAEDERLTLSRALPVGRLDPDRPAPSERIRVLPVVSNADPARLGPVDAADVLEALAKAGDSFDILTPLEDVTDRSLAERIREDSPQLVHFMGHGQFDGRHGSVALRDSHGDRVWIDAADFAESVCAGATAPQLVVLHTCEGGKTDFTDRFAGMAPELVSRGVRSVVAMQYVVEAVTAREFSAGLYDELARGSTVDVAVQAARRNLEGQPPRDFRLLGMPMLYLRNTAPLLTGAVAAAGGEDA